MKFRVQAIQDININRLVTLTDGEEGVPSVRYSQVEEIPDYYSIKNLFEGEETLVEFKPLKLWEIESGADMVAGTRVETGENGVVIPSNNTGIGYIIEDVLEGGIAKFVFKVKGDRGVGLEFNWNGTSLGIRPEGETEYEYVDLKGETGEGLEFDWDDTSLGVKTESEEEFEYVELKGETGNDGKSAYQIAVDEGFEGDVFEWLASLQGEPGFPDEVMWNELTGDVEDINQRVTDLENVEGGEG